MGKRAVYTESVFGLLDHLSIKVGQRAVYVESVFGLLDRLLKQKPNISIIAREAYIMFSQNKTMEGLCKKTSAEQTELLCKARKSTANLRDKFKQCKEEIEQRRRAEINRIIEEKEAFNLRKVQVKEKYTSDIVTFGLWQSRDEVDNQVSSYEVHPRSDLP